MTKETFGLQALGRPCRAISARPRLGTPPAHRYSRSAIGNLISSTELLDVVNVTILYRMFIV